MNLIFVLPITFGKAAAMIHDWSGYDKAGVIYNGIEAILITLDNNCPKVSSKCKRLAQLVQRIQPMLIIPSAIFAAGNALKSVSFLHKAFHIIPSSWLLNRSLVSKASIVYGVVAYIGLYPAIIGVGFASHKIAARLNDYYNGKEKASDLLGDGEAVPDGLSIEYKRPDIAKGLESVMVARLFFSVITLPLNFSAIGVLNIALQSYSLISLAKRHWVNFGGRYALERYIGIEGSPYFIKGIVLSLFMRIYPTVARKGDKDCTICLEEVSDQRNSASPSYGVLGCENGHVLHLKCMTDWIKRRLPQIKLGGQLENLKAFVDRDRRIQSFSADLDSSVLPTCPNCRGLPPYDVKGEAVLTNNKIHDLSIKLIKK